MLSATYVNANIAATEQRRKAIKNISDTHEESKPECVIDYNRHVGGVDCEDQALASFLVMRGCSKVYRKICFYLHNILLCKMCILHCKIRKNTKVEFNNFQLRYRRTNFTNCIA